MRRAKPILLILFFLIIYVYICNITMLPNNIILFEGEELNLKTIYGLKITTKDSTLNNYEVMQTATNVSEKVSNNVGTVNLSLDLFGTIPLKEIDVNILPRTTVIPLGNAIGLKLYTDGVLVVGMSEIKGEDNIKYKPYENSGIEEGDRIIEVNNIAIKNTNELIENVNKCNGKKIEIVYIRDEDELTTTILPVRTSENEYKLGLWVRDKISGIGTITFYDPQSLIFKGIVAFFKKKVTLGEVSYNE